MILAFDHPTCVARREVGNVLHDLREAISILNSLAPLRYQCAELAWKMAADYMRSLDDALVFKATSLLEYEVCVVLILTSSKKLLDTAHEAIKEEQETDEHGERRYLN